MRMANKSHGGWEQGNLRATLHWTKKLRLATDWKLKQQWIDSQQHAVSILLINVIPNL